MLTINFKVRFVFLLMVFSFIYAIIDIINTERWWLLIVIYLIASINGLIAGNIGCHRYFCHNSFKTTRWKEIFLASWTVVAGLIMGPIGFSGIHNHHHRYSDTDKDFHSPQKYPWWYIALGFPILIKNKKIEWTRASRNLFNDPVLLFIEHHYFKLWTMLMILAYIIGDIELVLYGFLAPAGLWNIQANLLINCFGHFAVIGSYSTFNNNDHSVNNKIINWITWGEGLQNNHHRYPGKYNHAMESNEFDPAAWIIDKFFILKD